MLIMLGIAILGVLVEAFIPRPARYRTQLVLAIGGQIAALTAVGSQALHLGSSLGRVTVVGAVAVDRPALFLQGTILLIGLLATLLIGQRIPAGGLVAFTAQASSVPGSATEKAANDAGIMQTEVFPLAMFALAGMMLFGAADDLLALFVALEVLSLPLYLMCGLARRRRLLSQEASLKYFLLGAFSSAFFLFGIAMLYGYSGTLSLTGIASTTGSRAMALVGIALLSVGLLFKVGAVPFHSWLPDVYQGAPTPVTAFMAAATKIAAFGALLRVFYVALPGLAADWRPVLAAIAVLTMVVGTVTAIAQHDVKRMLAYSSVAHTGFILTGVVALNDSGLSASLFYLFAYGFSTLGAFAVVSVVRDATGDEETDMRRWAGLGRRYPFIGVVFSLFLLAFAGIPLTSGFVSKFAVFKAAAVGGAAPLVVVGVIASAVAAYFYVRVIVLMFFTEAPANAPEVHLGALSRAMIVLTAAVTLLLGALPQPLLNLADNADQFLR
ncbi:MAG: NADH-quinone oxidoreductase subunit NuoN [Mycobacterium sp.]